MNSLKRSRVPDVYIIGAQKSGTTTLFDWLAQHPEIYAHPLAKDYPYFSNERIFQEGNSHFFSFQAKAPCQKMTLGGDANAMYVEDGPRRMYALMPHAKLIAVLRDPVERAYSAYAHAVERLLDDRSLEQAIREELAGIEYSPDDALRMDYTGHGLYVQQLLRIFRYYPREQVKVVIFEELKDRPREILADIFRFLAVDDTFLPDMTIQNKTRGGQRFACLAPFLYGASSFDSLIRRVIRKLIPFKYRTAIRRFLVEFNRVPAKKPDFPALVRDILRQYYKKWNDDLEVFLGRTLERWQ